MRAPGSSLIRVMWLRAIRLRSEGRQGTSGATVEVVELLRNLLPKKVMIKASGGIKSKRQALELIRAGADRIGTSASLEIIGLETVTV